MNYKKVFLILMLVMVFSLTVGSVVAKAETVRIKSNTDFNDKAYMSVAKTTTKNFVISHTMKFTKKNYDFHSGSFVGYVSVKSKNPKIKIKSIQVKQKNRNLNKSFQWKTYKVNSNKKTVKLGKNTLAMVYQDGEWGQRTYIIKY